MWLKRRNTYTPAELITWCRRSIDASTIPVAQEKKNNAISGWVRTPWSQMRTRMPSTALHAPTVHSDTSGKLVNVWGPVCGSTKWLSAGTGLPPKCGHTQRRVETPSTLIKLGWWTGTGAKGVGCYVRHCTHDPTRATVASNSNPHTKPCGTGSTTEGDLTGASQTQE